MIRLLVCALTLWLPLSAAAADRSYKSPGLFDRVSFEDQVRIRKAPNGDGGVCDAANVAAGATGCPLLTYADLFGTLDGGFCVPDTQSNGVYIENTPGGALGYDPTTQTLFGGGNNNSGNRWIVELQPPATLITNSNPANLNLATVPARGVLTEPSEGLYATTSGPFPGDATSSSQTVPTASLVYDTNKLLVSFQYYYTSGSPTLYPFITRPLALTTTGAVSSFNTFTAKSGTAASSYWIQRMHVSFCGTVPSEWQTEFGGAYWCGNGNTGSVVGNQSYGPAMFVVDPANLAAGTGVADPLVFYPADHSTLGGWDTWAPGEMFEVATQITGAAMIGGTRTALFFGTMGTTNCYGPGLSDPNDPRIGTPYNNFTYCYDPLFSDEGPHGYPYYYRIWAYDMLDLAKVQNQTTNTSTGNPWKPWEILPYALWDHSFPIPRTAVGSQFISRGLQYDQTTKKLFLAQGKTCSGANSSIWRYSVDITP